MNRIPLTSKFIFCLIFLTMCPGCVNIPGSVEDALYYQFHKSIVHEGISQLKDQFKAGMSFPEYEERRKRLRAKAPKGNLIETGYLIVTKRGRIRLSKEKEALIRDFGLERNRIDLGLSLSLNRVTVAAEYGHFEIKVKQKYDGDWKVLFEYRIDF